MGDIDEFVTGVPIEVKKFIWRIQGLRVTLSSALPSNPSIEFEIGSSIGMTSKWKLEIKPDTKTNRPLEGRSIQFCVSKTEGEPTVKHFCCTATMKVKDEPREDISFKLNTNSPSARIDFWIRYGNCIDDELSIQVEFALCSSTFATTTGNETLSGGGDVLNEYGNLLKSGDNSDFVIQVKTLGADGECEEIIHVHKGILGARSSVFKAMLDTLMQERENGFLVIEDLSVESVKIMLKYIYTGNLDDGWKNVPDELVRAADKYDLPVLLDFLNRRLHSVCTFANAVKLRQLAKLHMLDMAVRNITAFITSNIDSILG